MQRRREAEICLLQVATAGQRGKSQVRGCSSTSELTKKRKGCKQALSGMKEGQLAVPLAGAGGSGESRVASQALSHSQGPLQEPRSGAQQESHSCGSSHRGHVAAATAGQHCLQAKRSDSGAEAASRRPKHVDPCSKLRAGAPLACVESDEAENKKASGALHHLKREGGAAQWRHGVTI